MKNFKKQYPPQTGAYAVKVKNGRGWDTYSTARFQISVGQDYHEGEKFKATMEWAKHRFDKVIICVNDTLQRFNHVYNDNLSEDSAFIKSESAGREWVERNIHFIRTLPHYEIHRWEEWRSRKDYQSEYNRIIQLYTSESSFREMLNLEVMAFWDRKRKTAGDKKLSNFDGFKKASTEYLLEETAAFFLMFKANKAVDIYPGSSLLPCVLAHKYGSWEDKNLFPENYFTRIDFARNEDRVNNSQIDRSDRDDSSARNR